MPEGEPRRPSTEASNAISICSPYAWSDPTHAGCQQGRCLRTAANLIALSRIRKPLDRSIHSRVLLAKSPPADSGSARFARLTQCDKSSGRDSPSAGTSRGHQVLASRPIRPRPLARTGWSPRDLLGSNGSDTTFRPSHSSTAAYTAGSGASDSTSPHASARDRRHRSRQETRFAKFHPALH